MYAEHKVSPSYSEAGVNATQLHLLKVVISQRLVASEPLTLVDEDQSAHCGDHYWVAGPQKYRTRIPVRGNVPGQLVR